MTKHSGPPAGERPLRPSKETGRIATGLASLSASLGSSGEISTASPSEGESLSAATIEEAMRARRLRADFLPPELLSEAAWDMLLALLHAEITGRRMAPSHLCAAASVPASAVRRWIDALVLRGFCSRPVQSADADVTWVSLSRRGSHALRAYFTELQRSGSAPVR